VDGQAVTRPLLKKSSKNETLTMLALSQSTTRTLNLDAKYHYRNHS